MKIDRLISIIMILLDKKRVGAQELADMFEVSPLTIYRDIDSINLAGIPVHAIPGVGGGFEIMPNYKLDQNVFSLDDLSTILIGLSSVSNMMKGNELVNVLEKVKRLIPNNQAKDIELKTNQICIDFNPWSGSRNLQPYLKIIQTALQEYKLLSFDYVNNHGNKTSRIVEPYQLVLKNSYWYLQGFCHMRNDFRLFKFSRMANLQIKEDTFIPRDYQKPQLDISDMLSSMQTEIKIRIHHSVMDQVLDYCSYDQFTPDGNEHYIVQFPFIENDYYYNILFSFGDKCECLEPLHIRTEMKRRIENIRRMYE